MKEAKEYYNISILDGMLVSNEESVIEAIQMAINDAEKEMFRFIEWIRDNNYTPIIYLDTQMWSSMKFSRDADNRFTTKELYQKYKSIHERQKESTTKAD